MHSSLQCMQTHFRLLSCNTHTRTQSPDSATLLCTVCTTRITQVCSGTQLQCIAMSREYTYLHWLCDKHLGIALNRSMIGGKVAVVVKSLTCVVWFGFICCVRKVGVSILAESWKKIVGVAWHLFFVHQLQRFLCHKIDTGSPSSVAVVAALPVSQNRHWKPIHRSSVPAPPVSQNRHWRPLISSRKKCLLCLVVRSRNWANASYRHGGSPWCLVVRSHNWVNASHRHGSSSRVTK